MFHGADQQRPHAQGVSERPAVRRFAEWCEGRGIGERVAVQPFHVAAFIKELQGGFAPPTVEQHMAALRMLVRLAGDGAYPRREPGPCGPLLAPV
jgi:hypothetical protein